MTGTIATGSIPRLLQLGLDEVFGNSYNEFPSQIEKIYEMRTSSKAFEVDAQLEGFPLAPAKDEGDSVSFASRTQGFTPKYKMITYALGFIATKEALRDELYDQLMGHSKMLGRALRETKQVVGTNVLNNGFDPLFTMIDGDGSPLFATDHVNGPSGGTFANKLAVDADLTEASLEDMLIIIGNATDPRGNKIELQATRLIIPVALQFEAQRILGSVLQNDTANNATNAIKDMNAIRDGHTVNNYLTDSDAWFMKTNAPNGLKFFQRQAVEFGDDNAFTSGNQRMKADERFAPGWSEPRGMYASAGS